MRHGPTCSHQAESTHSPSLHPDRSRPPIPGTLSTVPFSLGCLGTCSVAPRTLPRGPGDDITSQRPFGTDPSPPPSAQVPHRAPPKSQMEAPPLSLHAPPPLGPRAVHLSPARRAKEAPSEPGPLGKLEWKWPGNFGFSLNKQPFPPPQELGLRPGGQDLAAADSITPS